METSTLMETTAEYDYYDYYAFNHSFHDDLYFEEPTAEVRHIASLVVFSTVIVLSLIGNILVVVMSVFCMRLQSLTSIFILNLALSDLLFTVGLLFSVCDLVGLTIGNAVFVVFSLFFSAGFYSSIALLMLMTVRHYMAVVQPQSGWKKGRWVTRVLICVWIVSILASLPVPFPNVPFSFSRLHIYSSNTAFLTVTYKENISFACAFLFMAFFYILILLTICKSPPNQKHRITGLTFILVATFFIFWAPHKTVNFLYTLTYYQMSSTQDLKHLDYASYICHVLALTRCCLNPVIYGLFGLIFRKTARNIFRRGAALNSELRAN